MLFCPYCIDEEEPSDALDDFRFGAGWVAKDAPNKRTLEFVIHSHGCERVFLAVVERPGRGLEQQYLACFKLPQDWDQLPPAKNPPSPPPF
jgi:hypothetical protein